VFEPVHSNPQLEKELTTADSLLRKEFKEICDYCGKVVYEGPNTGEALAKFNKHLEEGCPQASK